jgi:hypothetical protein
MAIFHYLWQTIVIEAVLLAVLARRFERLPQGVLLLANCLTWPLLQVLWRDYYWNIWLLEALAALTEAGALWLAAACAPRAAVVWAVLVNAGSLAIGILLYGWPT